MNVTASSYDFHDQWEIAVSLKTAWEIVSDSADWQQWWPGLKSAVITNYHEDIIDSSVNLTWRSKSGYHLKHTVTITGIEPGRIIRFKSTGDLMGHGAWRFEEHGGITHMTIDWHVQTTKWWMNVLAPVLRPLFVRNHTELMKRGEAGLNKHVQSI